MRAEYNAEHPEDEPMPTIAIEGQSQLAELVGQLAPGEEVTLTRDDRPVATLKAAAPAGRPVPKLGTLAGTVLSMDRFDEPLEEFEEYM